jgi:uncharacterized protein (TIGR03067 family)
MTALQGEWETVEYMGKTFTPSTVDEGRRGFRLIIRGHHLTLHVADNPGLPFTCRMETDKTPPVLHLTRDDRKDLQPLRWYFGVMGDRLRIVNANSTEEKPSNVFKATPSRLGDVMELKRVPRSRMSTPDAGASEHVSTTRTMQIPFRIAESVEGRIAGLTVFAFTADGKEVSRTHVSPSAREFRFVAPSDGVYRFRIQVRYTDGRLEPADIANMPTQLQVRVHTGEP